MSGNENRAEDQQRPNSVRSNEIPVIRVELHWEKPVPGPNHSSELRGALSARFPENLLFHQHKDNTFVYRYPLIHYRWQKGNGVLVGFHEGARDLLKIEWPGLLLHLGQVEARIMDVDFSCKMESFEFSQGLQQYKFRTPWLPFNQENYKRYLRMTPDQQAQERNRLLISNLLSAAKGLGVFLNQQVLASFIIRRSLFCRYKDQQLLGFFGTVVTNLNLPSEIAIGSKVSHGFGCLISETPRLF